MSENSGTSTSNVIHLDDRLRDVEKSLTALVTEVRHLAEIAAKSQSQIAEQSIIQTEMLSTVKRSIDQVNELRLEHDALAAKIYDLELWRGKVETNNDVIRKAIAPVSAIIVGVLITILAQYLSK